MIFESITCFFLSPELSNSACLINAANPKFKNFENCVGDYIENFSKARLWTEMYFLI